MQYTVMTLLTVYHACFIGVECKPSMKQRQHGLSENTCQSLNRFNTSQSLKSTTVPYCLPEHLKGKKIDNVCQIEKKDRFQNLYVVLINRKFDQPFYLPPTFGKLSQQTAALFTMNSFCSFSYLQTQTDPPGWKCYDPRQVQMCSYCFQCKVKSKPSSY